MKAFIRIATSLHLLVLLVGAVDGRKKFERESVMPAEALESGTAKLNIQLYLPGEIHWKYVSGNSVQFLVAMSAGDRGALNSIDVVLDIHKARNAATLVVNAKTTRSPVAVAYRSQGNVHTISWVILVLSALYVVYPDRRHSIWCYLVIFGCISHMVYSYRNESHRYVKITVQVPRDFQFREAFLFSLDGKVRVPDTLTKSNTSLSCATTFASSRGCFNCCHGHGVCSKHNKCICDTNSTSFGCGPPKPKITMFVNPGDNKITSTRMPGGDVIETYGKKRRDGTVRTYHAIRRLEKSTGKWTTVILDRKYRIRVIRSVSGSVLRFRWYGKSRVYVKAVTGDGRKQVNVDVKLQMNATISDIYNATMAKLKRRIRRSSSDINEHINRVFNDAQRSDQKAPRSNVPYVHVPVTVTRCGIPEGSAELYARVNLDFVNGTWSSTAEYRGIPTGVPGVFYVKIPNKPADRAEDALDRTCSSIKAAVVKTCSTVSEDYEEYEKKICDATEGAFKFVKGTTQEELDDIRSTCRSGFFTVITHCKTMDFSPKDGGAFDCKQVQERVDTFSNNPILFTPLAIFPGSHTVPGESRAITIEPDMVYLNEGFTVEDDKATLEITDFSVTPNDPQPLERYKVRTQYICANNDTKVEMIVTGTDFYSNYITCHGDTDCNCCILKVAGAAELVVDTVSVSVINTVTGQNFTRNVVVVF